MLRHKLLSPCPFRLKMRMVSQIEPAQNASSGGRLFGVTGKPFEFWAVWNRFYQVGRSVKCLLPVMSQYDGRWFLPCCPPLKIETRSASE